MKSKNPTRIRMMRLIQHMIKTNPMIKRKVDMSKIERNLPNKWDDMVGNTDLKEHLRCILRDVSQGKEEGLNTLIYGPSRSGKSAAAHLFGQCLLCEAFDPISLNPCGKCSRCTSRWDILEGARGLHTVTAKNWR